MVRLVAETGLGLSLTKSWTGFDPGFERPACLATLKSSDWTKQSVCGWQYIYIYIYTHAFFLNKNESKCHIILHVYYQNFALYQGINYIEDPFYYLLYYLFWLFTYYQLIYWHNDFVLKFSSQVYKVNSLYISLSHTYMFWYVFNNRLIDKYIIDILLIYNISCFFSFLGFFV